MKRIQVDTDEAVQLDITCTQGRTFELNIDCNQPLIGQDYQLDVRDFGGNLIVGFALADATIVISDDTISLRQAAQDMNVPSGCYTYELVQVMNGKVENLFRGSFTIKPSVTR